MLSNPVTVGLLGAGSVGRGWAASYLAAGHKVIAFDPNPEAPVIAHAYLTRSWPALKDMGVTTLETPPLSDLKFASFDEVVAGADHFHENGPEDLEQKRKLYARIEDLSVDDRMICSSSGGIPPSDLQSGMKRPQRLVVVHPFNPPHLIPLVEIVAGAQTERATIEQAIAIMKAIHKHPIEIKKEMVAYMANRLQFALLREAIFCLQEGVADASAIDDALRYALAPRWAIMGPLRTFALAGGAGGMERTLELFADANQKWWDALGTVRLSADVRKTLIEASAELFQEHSVEEWVHIRDERLPGVIKASLTKD